MCTAATGTVVDVDSPKVDVYLRLSKSRLNGPLPFAGGTVPKPNVFVCHRWKYNEDYYKLIAGFAKNSFPVVNYSVPEHDPLDWVGKKRTYDQLTEQVRQCNYFIVFGRMATNTEWCEHEVGVAMGYRKPVLAVKPVGYGGVIPGFIAAADNQGGPMSFNAPRIIERIRTALNWWE